MRIRAVGRNSGSPRIAPNGKQTKECAQVLLIGFKFLALMVNWADNAKDCAKDCLWDMLPIPDLCGKFGKFFGIGMGVAATR